MSMEINEIKKMDDMVEKYELNRYITTEKSRRFWQGSEMRSDQMFQSWEQFVLKRIANKNFGTKWSVMEDWGPKECRAFYNERLLEGRTLPESYHLNLSDKAVETLLSSVPQEAIRALQYRWNNGYAFKNYRARVFYGIDSIADTLGEQAGRIVKLIQTAENDMASVKGELDAVVSTTIMSSRAKYLIEYMNSNLRLGQFLEDLDEDSQ